MGLYDSVMVKCPNCGTENEFQSKSGDCLLEDYTLENCPDDVLENVNRHAPIDCIVCDILYSINRSSRSIRIHIPIEQHFAGDYKLEYDGKYVSLIGKDKNYEINAYHTPSAPEHEEMVLIGCIIEIKNADPRITYITNEEIVVDLGNTK